MALSDVFTVLDQNLKQRLIGAAVLIGVGVGVIPFLLQGPAELSPSDVERGAESLTSYAVPSQVDPVLEKGGRTKQEHEAVPAASERNSSPRTNLTSTPAPTKAPAADSSPAKAPAQEAGEWLVQIGSFTQQDNARRMRDEVAALGYKAFIHSVKKGTQTVYRVKVGPEREEKRAKKLKEELERRLHVKAFLIAPSAG